MKRRNPVIHNLTAAVFPQLEDNYYQLVFNQDPDTVIKINNTTIEECKFIKINFNLLDLRNTHLVDCVFENCDLSNVEFERISIHRCHFINCKMTGVSFNDCSLQDLMFDEIQGRYLNISYGSIRNVLFSNSVLDEASFLEIDVRNLEFNQVSFVRGEIFKTRLSGMDLKTTNIEGLRIDMISLQGIHVDMYQAIALSSLLGIIVD